jgi:hypothetical protein
LFKNIRCWTVYFIQKKKNAKKNTNNFKYSRLMSFKLKMIYLIKQYLLRVKSQDHIVHTLYKYFYVKKKYIIFTDVMRVNSQSYTRRQIVMDEDTSFKCWFRIYYTPLILACQKCLILLGFLWVFTTMKSVYKGENCSWLLFVLFF